MMRFKTVTTQMFAIKYIAKERKKQANTRKSWDTKKPKCHILIFSCFFSFFTKNASVVALNSLFLFSLHLLGVLCISLKCALLFLIIRATKKHDDICLFFLHLRTTFLFVLLTTILSVHDSGNTVMAAVEFVY